MCTTVFSLWGLFNQSLGNIGPKSIILFQTSPENGEAELYYLRLPKDIRNYRVILMDATVASGASAMMAIRVLLDHDVPEENIHLVKIKHYKQ